MGSKSLNASLASWPTSNSAATHRAEPVVTPKSKNSRTTNSPPTAKPSRPFKPWKPSSPTPPTANPTALSESTARTGAWCCIVPASVIRRFCTCARCRQCEGWQCRTGGSTASIPPRILRRVVYGPAIFVVDELCDDLRGGKRPTMQKALRVEKPHLSTDHCLFGTLDSLSQGSHA